MSTEKEYTVIVQKWFTYVTEIIHIPPYIPEMWIGYNKDKINGMFPIDYRLHSV